MIPFVVLLTLFAVLSAADYLLPFSYGWWTSLRVALAGMFLLTASAHWGRRRSDLIEMVPAAFARPDFLVTVTGILEVCGAIGLMLPAVAPYAALGLTLLLIAVFPANVHAARTQLKIAGRPVEPLVPRTLLQVVFLMATITVFMGGIER
jgi:uncharacterized membrane protein